MFGFHVASKAEKKRRLFEDDQDKLFYLTVALQETKRVNLRINSFDVLNTHAHLILGSTDESMSQDKIDSFVNSIHRKYGRYLREKYQISKDTRIFTREPKLCEPIINTRDYYNKVIYVNTNSCTAHINHIPEESHFSSYNFFVARFLDDKRFHMAKEILNCPEFYGLYKQIDYKQVLKLFGKNDSSAMKSFVGCCHNYIDKAHYKKDYWKAEIEERRSKMNLPPVTELVVNSDLRHPIDIFLNSINYVQGIEDTMIILNQFAKYFGIEDIQGFFLYLRKWDVKVFNKLIIELCSSFSQYRVEKISGIGKKSISNIIKKAELGSKTGF